MHLMIDNAIDALIDKMVNVSNDKVVDASNDSDRCFLGLIK